jgi:hypothetical protein
MHKIYICKIENYPKKILMEININLCIGGEITVDLQKEMSGL